MQPTQYPPQQGYAPQPQYPPQQAYPQQAPPQYPPQQYGAPAPTQAPPAPGYGGPHPQGVPAFRPPDAPQANIIRPRLQDIGRDNRLVLISPIKVERDLPNNLGKPGDKQDRMTADVVILDGPPFMFGGMPEKDSTKPHTHQGQAPYEILSMFLSSGPLISQCERRIGEMVLGRLSIRQLPNGNTAYRLSDPTPDDERLAQQYLVDKMAGKIAPPQQIPATQPVAPAAYASATQYPTVAQGPQYPPQQAYPQQGAPQYPPQQYGAPAPAQMPAQGMVGPPPGYAEVAVPQGAQPPAPQAWAPPAAQLDIDTPPVGADPDWWRAQPPEYRQMVAAQAASRPGV